MILPPLLSDGEAEIPLLSAVLLPPAVRFWRSWERIPDSWERMRCSPRSLPGFSGSLREISGSLLRIPVSLREISDSLLRMLVSQWGFFRKPTSPHLSLMEGFFRKPTSPPLPLREAPPLSPSPFPLRGQGMCQPPYSVLKPLRYKVGGPSEVSPAAELRFAVCDRKDMRERRSCRKPRSP